MEPLATQFRLASGCVRAVLIVSPTCQLCLDGALHAGAQLLDALSDVELRAYYVWVPMLPSDCREAAEAAAQRFSASRALHYWDPGRQFGRLMAQRLGINPGHDAAWDVYLAYPRGVTGIAQPAFWMHQLEEAGAPRLDPRQWRRKIKELLRQQPALEPGLKRHPRRANRSGGQ
jgi:hypothetical protein